MLLNSSGLYLELRIGQQVVVVGQFVVARHGESTGTLIEVEHLALADELAAILVLKLGQELVCCQRTADGSVESAVLTDGGE